MILLDFIFVWTLQSVIIVTLFGIALIITIYALIKHWFNVTFKKNCNHCKHCHLHSVPSCGDGATYKCDIKEKNRTIRKNIDNWYIFCKDFKK